PQKTAYVIADNQLALDAGWDKDLLRVEIAELSGEDFELGLLGFDDLELKGLLRDDTVLGEDGEAPIEVPQHPTTRAGDLWVLGNHRLLCGDSTVSVRRSYSRSQMRRVRPA